MTDVFLIIFCQNVYEYKEMCILRANMKRPIYLFFIYLFIADKFSIFYSNAIYVILLRYIYKFGFH